MALFSLLGIELSDMALEKSAEAAIRSFAGRLLHDHAEMNQALREIVPDGGDLAELAPPLARARGQLEKQSGPGFDLSYLQLQLALSERILHLLQQKRGEQERDPALEKLVETFLPMLRRHREMALSLRAALFSPAQPPPAEASPAQGEIAERPA